MALHSMFPLREEGDSFEWATLLYQGLNTIRFPPLFITNQEGYPWPAEVTPYTNDPVLIGSCIAVPSSMSGSYLVEGNAENLGTVMDPDASNWVLWLVKGSVTISYSGPS